MFDSVVIIAPHYDDEVLGCGGLTSSLVKRGRSKITIIYVCKGWFDDSDNKYINCKKEARAQVLSRLKGVNCVDLGLCPGQLGERDLSSLVLSFRQVLESVACTSLFLPFFGDSHSDHVICAKAALSASKWFRSPTLRRIFAYETPSETNILPLAYQNFSPNFFWNISDSVESKINLCELYDTEFGLAPFPRSPEVIRSLAAYRGSQAGCLYAEAFFSIWEVYIELP